jgi:hypothetical protein
LGKRFDSDENKGEKKSKPTNEVLAVIFSEAY